jgi:hypothetical protein
MRRSRPAPLFNTGMLVAVLVTLTALRAGAQPTREQAARLGARAQEACVAGNHDEALRLYEEAFRLRPQPRRDYYLGIEQQHLDHPVEAVEALERYLEVAGGEPEFMADAASRRSELRARIGEIELVASEGDTAVFVDGQPRTTGPGGRIKVRAGLRRVVLRKAGFEPFEATAQVAAGGRTVLPAQLRPEPLELRESSSPPALRESETLAPHRHTDVTLLAGAALWRDVAQSPGSAAAMIGLSHPLAGEQLELRLSARASLATISKDHNLAFELMGGPVLRYADGPGAVAISVELGAGLMVLAGLEPRSPLLKPNVAAVTGAISRLALRPAVSVDVPLSAGLAVVGSAGMSWSPAPSDDFVSSSLVRFEVVAGVAFRF